ncbi:hypothetical protein B0H11DRAFT_2282232 [Mycena galericulata]|nr:hypothetical protein B0H11DRAFT_2282232 [Mycena galericulata]
MSSRDQIPEELWLDIFLHLPRKTLINVSVTEHVFRRLCLPLLFTDFRFYPYTSDSRDGSIVPPTTEIQVHLDRLNFWSSEEIAPLVRSCHVTGDETWWDDGATAATATSVYASFFDSLPSFTGIRRLDAHGIHFTQTGLANVCRLPVLSDLRINQCDLAAGESIETASLNLAVSRFSFIHTRSAEYHGVDYWIQLLRPDRLRELEVSGTPRVFWDMVDVIPSFPLVHKLSASMLLSIMPKNLPILSKFPAVQIFALSDLGMTDPEDVEGANASNVLPVLKEYTGPCATLRIFLGCSTLTRFMVPHCDPAIFIAQLPGIQAHITSVNVTFWDLDATAFRTLCASFPRLTELRVGIDYLGILEHGHNSKAKTFFSELADNPTLPSTLERLGIFWEFYEPASFDTMDDFDGVRDALVKQCPTLTFLWLDGYDFLFHWRKLRDGAETQMHANDRHDAYRVRKGFEAMVKRSVNPTA